MTPLPHDTGPQRHLQPLSRLAAATALLLGTVTAQAHHGWSWAEGEQMTLQGQIARISMAPPHPVLTVQAADGGRWQVDLGNPSQTERSGLPATRHRSATPSPCAATAARMPRHCT
jgi:hypothetical protein